jgi:hypothetical protein
MKVIGGYFELELSKDKEYHQNAFRLNTGRNAFEHILRAKKYEKVYLPCYTCDAMLEPIRKLALRWEFYNIDETLMPIFNFSSLDVKDVFVYNNYFGVCDMQVAEIAKKCRNVVIDNSQAFFSKPAPDIDTFYSPRKFFGVPDGAYLYTDKLMNSKFERDASYTRFAHLIKRIDINEEAGYVDFKDNESMFAGQPIRLMSALTQRLLESFDYIDIAKKRRQNFNYLHSQLRSKNSLTLQIEDEAVPMVYPFLVTDGDKIKKRLISQKIFVATYWLDVLDRCAKDDIEYELVKNIVFLPVDQRYEVDEMAYICEKIELSIL